MNRRSSAVLAGAALAATLVSGSIAGYGREAKAPPPPERKLNVFI